MDTTPTYFTLIDAAALAGISPQTLRAYERDGLLTVPRNSAGCRVFTMEVIGSVRQIAEARTLRAGRNYHRRTLLVVAR